MDSLSSGADSDGEYVEWTTELQRNRLLIMDNVVYEKLSPALQSARIFDNEDDEIIRNQFQNPTFKNRTNAMVDHLLRKGRDNYEKFLDILGNYYPKVFTKITGKDPPTPPPSPPAVLKYSLADGDNEVLSFCFARLQITKQECSTLKEANELLRRQLNDSKMEMKKLNAGIEDYARMQARHEKLQSDLSEQQRVTEEVRAKNDELFMSLVKMNDEKSKLKEENMELRLDSDKQAAEIRTMNGRINSERSQSIRLRRQIDTGPSQREINYLQSEIENLKMKMAQSHEKENYQQSDPDKRVKILQKNLNAAAEVYETSSREVKKLREKLDEAESLKDKFLAEKEQLELRCAALEADCRMYKTRRDTVCEEQHEVELERDRLMKERNDAQLNAQTYLEEKTKFRYRLHQAEEMHDKFSRELRDKEHVIKMLKAKVEAAEAPEAPEAPGTGATDGLDLIQDLPSDLERSSTFGSFSSACDGSHPDGLNKGRITRRRRPLDSTRSSYSEERERSLSNVIRDDIFHTLVEADGKMHQVDLMGKTIQDCVELTGGNETGIFIESVVNESYAQVIGLVPGMKVLKIGMSDKNARELHLRNCTLENVINIFQEIGDSFTIYVQYLKEEFEAVQEMKKNCKRSGDSFYVRANFSLRKENYISFEKGSVLHVVDTQPDKLMKDWRAYLVDSISGEDLNKPGLIPSYRNCLQNTQLLRTYQPLIRPLSSSLDFTRLFRTMPGSQDFCTSLTTDDINSGSKCIPYTVIKKAPVGKVEYRPCLFVPQSLSNFLSLHLPTMSDPFQFDLPLPISRKCNEEEAHRRVVSSEAISCKMISAEMHEFITVDGVKRISEKKKHCILQYNCKCMSLESFVLMLHASEIYPIIFYVSGEKDRGLKLLQQYETKDLASVSQDVKKERLILDKYIPQYATINLDRCGRPSDVVQQVMEQVAIETNKIVWISGKSDVQI